MRGDLPECSPTFPGLPVQYKQSKRCSFSVNTTWGKGGGERGGYKYHNYAVITCSTPRTRSASNFILIRLLFRHHHKKEGYQLDQLKVNFHIFNDFVDAVTWSRYAKYHQWGLFRSSPSTNHTNSEIESSFDIASMGVAMVTVTR